MTTDLFDEQGVTLVELIVAVAIMGIAFVTILAGLTTTMRTSAIHRQQARGEAIVREYAESNVAAASICQDSYGVLDRGSWSVTSTVTKLDGGAIAVGDCSDDQVQLVHIVASNSAEDLTEKLDVVKRRS
jgi:prepilin-type N-terminal cleavage/methylation domain-containing protein